MQLDSMAINKHLLFEVNNEGIYYIYNKMGIKCLDGVPFSCFHQHIMAFDKRCAIK